MAEMRYVQVQTAASGSMTLGLWLEDAAALKGVERGKRMKIVKTRSVGSS
jgi:hypothetical protein